MIEPADIPLAELLPHGPSMIVIDRLVTFDAARSVARVEVRRGSKFFERTGVPGWVGIEYMAQAVAAHAGFEARLRGNPPALGFLLGTRSYECRTAEFALGARLRIVVEPRFVELGLAAFGCAIELDEQDTQAPLAEALISVYRPRSDEIARMGAPLEEP